LNKTRKWKTNWKTSLSLQLVSLLWFLSPNSKSSNQIKSNQIKSNQIKSNQIKSFITDSLASVNYHSVVTRIRLFLQSKFFSRKFAFLHPSKIFLGSHLSPQILQNFFQCEVSDIMIRYEIGQSDIRELKTCNENSNSIQDKGNTR